MSWYPPVESNHNLRFRKPSFYPLNQEGIIFRDAKIHKVFYTLIHSAQFRFGFVPKRKTSILGLGLRRRLKKECMLWLETYVLSLRRFYLRLSSTLLVAGSLSLLMCANDLSQPFSVAVSSKDLYSLCLIIKDFDVFSSIKYTIFRQKFKKLPKNCFFFKKACKKKHIFLVLDKHRLLKSGDAGTTSHPPTT